MISEWQHIAYPLPYLAAPLVVKYCLQYCYYHTWRCHWLVADLLRLEFLTHRQTTDDSLIFSIYPEWWSHSWRDGLLQEISAYANAGNSIGEFWEGCRCFNGYIYRIIAGQRYVRTSGLLFAFVQWRTSNCSNYIPKYNWYVEQS